MTARGARAAGLAGVLLLSLGVVEVRAQVEPGGDDEPVRWGFYHNIGFGQSIGDFDDSLEDLWTGEFGIQREKGAWRYGLGTSFGSFAMKMPWQDEAEFGFQRIYLSGTRTFGSSDVFRPYVQGRVGIARMHSRSELFAPDPLPDDFMIGDSPTPAYNGFHVGVLPGVEWQLSPTFGLDLSLMADYARVSNVDLSPIGMPPASSALDWGVRLGVVWWNDGGPGAVTAPRDAWGLRPSWAWGIGEAMAINFAASAANEYVRNKNFNQISPRSWLSNIEDGFTYDDNEFANNQFVHPFNGSQYFNAARSNGLDFWSSSAVAMWGAFHWELAGETHPMSINDLIATGVGGIAMGEAQYRLSSMMLDNEATGLGRFFREAGGFVVDPIRGFNRVVSGRAWEVRPNPTDLQDTNPVGQVNGLYVGWRRIGDGVSLQENTDDYGFIEFVHEHGDVFNQRRRGAFDYFTFDGQLDFGDKSRIGRLTIRGNWLTTPVGDRERPNHMLGVVQHFQYINNNAYEYGGQSVGPSLFSRWASYGSYDIETRADILVTVMGAVNSDASELADVADQERIREYDYGPGAGGNAEFALTRNGEPLLTIGYQLQFLYTLNGSIYHQDENVGLDSTHWLHGVDARLELPIARSFGVGIRYNSFTRESHYEITIPQELPPGASLQQLIKQSNPELRLYLTYVPSVRLIRRPR